MSEPRGVVRSIARATQHIDFSGLRWSKITPTNIDGVLDFAKRLFGFLEFKMAGAPFPAGQRYLFEAIRQAIVRGETMCVVLIAEHEAIDARMPIVASTAAVIEILDGPEWRAPLRPVTVREAIETYLRRAFPEAA